MNGILNAVQGVVQSIFHLFHNIPAPWNIGVALLLVVALDGLLGDRVYLFRRMRKYADGLAVGYVIYVLFMYR